MAKKQRKYDIEPTTQKSEGNRYESQKRNADDALKPSSTSTALMISQVHSQQSHQTDLARLHSHHSYLSQGTQSL